MSPELERKLSAWVPAVAWTVLIFCVSSIPGIAPIIFRFKFFDKLAHAIEYAGLGIFLTIAYRGSLPRGARLSAAALLAVATGLAIAVADEAYQLTVPGRAVEFHDWVADATGVVLGSLIMVYCYRRVVPWAARVAERLERG
ncbi:MAG: VanZ family protein [Candidatus Eisenbacteria bacterium]|nr:VanZ family protein [Candidatus Eisenbacteria bacterium]